MNGDQEIKLNVELIKKDIESVKILYGTYVKRLEGDNREVIKRLDGLTSLMKEQNSRVNKLENWRSYTAGAVGILVVVITIGIPMIMKDRVAMGVKLNKHLQNPSYHESIRNDVQWIRQNIITK